MPVPHYHPGFPEPRLTTVETSVQRGVRLDRERAMLDEGREQLRAGLGLDIDDPAVSDWLDGLDGEEDLPVPQQTSPRTHRS
jgi:hypothetical protein